MDLKKNMIEAYSDMAMGLHTQYLELSYIIPHLIKY